jgi:hypothetical protein
MRPCDHQAAVLRLEHYVDTGRDFRRDKTAVVIAIEIVEEKPDQAGKS